jgi:Kef-type K+ transport system membrane component KefB
VLGDFLAQSVFYEMAALLVLAALVGFVGQSLRQPLVVSFIAVGLLAGPSALGIARSEAHIDLLAELGIAVLLFLVGLKLDLALVRRLGRVALMTGLGQVAFTAAIGFVLALALGLDALTSLYAAVALTFSSTIIIVKLLSDKKEIDSLHGQIALGILIVQDVVVVFAMILLSAMGVGDGGDGAIGDILLVVLYGGALLGVVILFVRYVATPLVERLAEAPELLVAFALGWTTLLAAVGHYLGFGKELGGLLAGVSLASTPYREALAARLASLRDFLLLFFFIGLGASLDLSVLGAQIGPALVLSLFVLIGNPVIVLAIMGAMGYRKRTGFLTGLTVAQISEFSLIFMAMGVTLGHVDTEALGLVTLVGLITIAASTYMISYSHRLYGVFEPALGVFERAHARREQPMEAGKGRHADAVVFGLGRYGGAIAERLRARGWRVLGVDFDPGVVRRWRERGLDVVYGDASDPELLSHLPLARARWIVAAVPEHPGGLTHEDPRHVLLRGLTEQGFAGRTALAVHHEDSVRALGEAGVDLVLSPFRDAADQAVDLIFGKDQPSPAPVLEPANQRSFAD